MRGGVRIEPLCYESRMRVPSAILVGCLAVCGLFGTGCASLPNQAGGDTRTPPSISSDRWTEVWSVKAPAAPNKDADGPLFAVPGGKLLVRVLHEVPMQDWSFSWDLRPAGWPKKALALNVLEHSKTIRYAWDGKSGQDYLLTRVPKGRYYLNYMTDRACTIAAYVEK